MKRVRMPMTLVLLILLTGCNLPFPQKAEPTVLSHTTQRGIPEISPSPLR